MNLNFDPISENDRIAVIDIFNHYVTHSFAAYPDQKVSYDYFDEFLNIAQNYPAFTMRHKNQIIGFCFLNAYHPLSSFIETAVITYFIHKGFKGRGFGKAALNKLENESKQKGIKSILANIASLNEESLSFHRKNGFKECGKFEQIIKKKNTKFDIIWMQKKID